MKNIKKAIKLLKIIVYFLPRLIVVMGFLRTFADDVFPDKKAEIKRRGVTIPKTYIAPIKIAPQKFGDKNAKVSIPIKTGAQQAEVIPENTPSIKIEIISVLPVFRPGIRGIGSFIPRRETMETKTITIPPIINI